ncbi:hypothetical protein AQI96_23405 [Streptomyces canus]|nr:hypothetical protein AQI96_23405 [Streptomyces canus]
MDALIRRRSAAAALSVVDPLAVVASVVALASSVVQLAGLPEREPLAAAWSGVLAVLLWRVALALVAWVAQVQPRAPLGGSEARLGVA